MERRYIIVGFSANWSTLLKAQFILKSVEGCSGTSTNLQTLTITCFLTEQKLTKNSYPESGLKHQMSNNTLSLEKTMSWVACCLNIHCTISFIMMVYSSDWQIDSGSRIEPDSIHKIWIQMNWTQLVSQWVWLELIPLVLLGELSLNWVGPYGKLYWWIWVES